MNITIRQMVEDDWPRMAEIYRQGIETGKATFQSEIPEYRDWNASHMKECRLAAISEGKVVGWAALSAVSSRCVYKGVAELSIYIAQEARANGVGCKLLNALKEASEKAGIWMLQSGIMEDNTASLKLHEKCGFRRVGYREKIARDCKGQWRSTVLMERRSSTVGID